MTLSFEEFQKACTTRRGWVRAVSFQQWCDDRGVDGHLSDFTEADVLGDLLFARQRTRATKGKQRAKVRAFVEHRQLREQYMREVPEDRPFECPLDLTQEADCAYQRAQYRRYLAMENHERQTPQDAAGADPGGGA